MMNDKELLQDLYNRLVDDYNENKAFKQREEDRLVVRHLLDTIVYVDSYITILCDYDKCLIIFVNHYGQTQVLNFDDNFYSIEENILAYNDLIKKATDDEQEQQEFLGNFIKFCENEMKECNEELNYEYLEHNDIKVRE